jgi:hypothetical protein
MNAIFNSIRHARVLTTAAFGLTVFGLTFSASTFAAGTDRDPLDGTGIANNPMAAYGILFGSICTYSLPSGNGSSAPGESQADEGLNISFGVVFECDPNDPSVGYPQEDVDRDRLPNE